MKALAESNFKPLYDLMYEEKVVKDLVQITTTEFGVPSTFQCFENHTSLFFSVFFAMLPILNIKVEILGSFIFIKIRILTKEQGL